MLLFPDVTRAQPEAETFVFAAPCDHHEWRRLDKHSTEIPSSPDGEKYLPYFVFREKDESETIIAILRGPKDSDEDCLQTAAYLRMVEEFRGMIYALPYHPNSAEITMADIIARTAGVKPQHVRHVSLPVSA